MYMYIVYIYILMYNCGHSQSSGASAPRSIIFLALTYSFHTPQFHCFVWGEIEVATSQQVVEPETWIVEGCIQGTRMHKKCRNYKIELLGHAREKCVTHMSFP